MTDASPSPRMRVGVVVERRTAASPWVDFTWQAVSLLAGAPEAEAWTILAENDQRTRFYAGHRELFLSPSEAAQYRDNLLSGAPMLWIALRPTGTEPPFRLIAVTADPAEGEALTEAGNDLVEALPMPPEIVQQVEAFVAEHHVERPFVKRRRDRADPQALARRGPARDTRGE